MWLLAWGCGVVHADGSAITFGEACALMGMLGCTILIPGPPGLLGVFQAGIYAGMTMYFPLHVVTGAGSAYVFLLYVIQLVWTIARGGDLPHRRSQGALASSRTRPGSATSAPLDAERRDARQRAAAAVDRPALAREQLTTRHKLGPLSRLA